jgi:hypothetical protein
MMNRVALDRIADWHGTMAAAAYKQWQHTQKEDSLRDYARHAYIADQLWKAVRKANRR